MEKLNFLKQKALLLLLLLVAAGGAKAQVCDSIMELPSPGILSWPDPVVPLKGDGLLYRIAAYNHTYHLDHHEETVDFLGYQYYWITRDGAQVSNSLFVESEGEWDGVVDLRAANPTGNGLGDYFRARVVDTTGRSDMVITYFDAGIDFDTDNELVVPLSDTLLTYTVYDFAFDRQGDIVMAYSIPTRGETHFVRVGLDGTLKTESVAQGIVPVPTYYPDLWQSRGLRQVGDSPPEYHYFGYGYDVYQSKVQFLGFVLDSTLNVTKRYEFNEDHYSPPYASYGSYDRMVPCDDGGIVVFSRYYREAEWPDTETQGGVVVAKYDQEGVLQHHRMFVPMPESAWAAKPCDIVEADGHYYMAYNTKDVRIWSPQMAQGSYVSLVKMDQDLNVVWQRFFLEGTETTNRMAVGVERLDDGSIVVYGSNIAPVGNTSFYYLFNEKGWGSPEAMAAVRPYAYWPNPVQDRLLLQYSPDVAPAQAELYDLQGRLARQQRTGLESLNLEGLAPGTYTLRVTLEDGKTFSDKVVKE